MRVLISADGSSMDGDGVSIPHLVVVDNHLLPMDLSGVVGTLVDPTIARVTWGLQIDGTETREGGAIFRRDGSRQLFWDKALLQPYLDAFEARKAELLAA